MNLPSQEAIDFASQKVQSDERGITRIEGVPFLKLDNLTQSPNNQAMVDGITIALARLFDEYLDTVLDECDCELEADMAIDADGLPFDLNERCHNPNCPCCVPPVYEVGCDCGKGDDVTTMSLIEVGSTLWQSGKDERRVIIKDDRGVIVASGELRVHDAEAFDGIRAK